MAPRARRCIILAGADGAPPIVAALLEVLARDLAAGGRCPLFDPGAAGPDSYRALDLEDQAAPSSRNCSRPASRRKGTP